MITIAMVHKPLDQSQHMWAINCAVFPIIHDANECWPGVKAYRLTGQEQYYETTWVPDKDSTGLEQVIQAAPNVEFTLIEEGKEIKTPSTERVEEGKVCSHVSPRKPLSFIDLKTKG